MSTREIAKLTGKRHDHVTRDTRKMLEKLHGEMGVPSFGDTLHNPQNQQAYPVFKLPHRETMILVSGYKLALRAKIIDRWQELGQAAKAPAINLNGPPSLRTALLDYTEKVQELQATVTEQAPKVEGFDRIANSPGALTLRAAASATARPMTQPQLPVAREEGAHPA